MKIKNEQFLEANFHHWVTLRDAFYLRGLNAMERDGMLQVMREEFSPNYSTDLTCPACVADMVRLLYTLYERWKAEQATVISEAVPEPVEIIKEPITVKANFPSHKKRRK